MLDPANQVVRIPVASDTGVHAEPGWTRVGVSRRMVTYQRLGTEDAGKKPHPGGPRRPAACIE